MFISALVPESLASENSTRSQTTTQLKSSAYAARMPWPSIWSSKNEIEKDKDGSVLDRAQNAAKDVTEPLEKIRRDPEVSTIVQAFTQPQTLLATVVLTTACLGLFSVYRTYLRRIPEATNIPQSYFRTRSVFGKVTSVGDGDNFRIYHTPGGWLAGWGWLPWRKVPNDRKELKNKTIHVRLAGVDAPEMAHFGRPSQPHAQESLDWLTSYVTGRRVRVHVHRPDQYSRVVATAYVWKGILRRDVGLQMLRAGMATVYEAKTGVEFGPGLEQIYRDAEKSAKTKRKGMWAGDQKGYESPRQYKSKYGSTDASTKQV